MFWEIVAIWAIIAVTLVWFVRDERQVQLAALKIRAAGFATNTAYRHNDAAPLVVEPAPAPVRPAAGLSPAQRKFIEALSQKLS